MLAKLKIVAYAVWISFIMYLIAVGFCWEFWVFFRYNQKVIVEITSVKKLSLASYELKVGDWHWRDKHLYELGCKFIRPENSDLPDKIYLCTTREKGLTFRKNEKLLGTIKPMAPATLYDAFILFGKSNYVFWINKWDVDNKDEKYVENYLAESKRFKFSFIIVYPILTVLLLISLLIFSIAISIGIFNYPPMKK